MKYLVIYLFLLFLILDFSAIQAQDSTNVKKWSINDCLKYASENNIQVNTLRLNELYSRQDMVLAKAAKLPDLYSAVSNTFNNANNNATTNGNLVNQLISSGSYSLNSSVVLWNDNYLNNNIRQKNLAMQSAGLSINQSVNNITLLITTAYLDILLSRENLFYISDLVKTSEARVKQGQQFYDAGSIARKELLQLQAQQASDRFLLVQTTNMIRQNILLLKQLLQLPGEILFDIAVPDSVMPSVMIPSLYIVQQSALQNFPEIKISKLSVDIAALDIAKARAAFKPVLSAGSSLGSGYSEVITNSTSSKTGYFKQVGNNFYQRLGLAVSIPIFSKRANKTNLEKASIAYRQADLNFKNSQLVLTQEVEQAYLNAANAREAYDAASVQLTAAEESYRIVNEQFKIGAINSYDLLQQRNQYVQAIQAYTQAKYTAVLQQKIYEFYMGKPVTL